MFGGEPTPYLKHLFSKPMIIETKPKETYCPDEEEALVFHYTKSEQLKNIQESYRDQIAQNSKGFFKVLVRTKTSRTLLTIMLVTFAITLLTFFLAPGDNQKTLAEGKFTLSAFSFEDTIYVSLECSQDFLSHEGLSVIFQALDTHKNIISEVTKEFIITEKNSFLRTTFVDYDIMDVVAIIQGKNGTITLTKSVEKR